MSLTDDEKQEILDNISRYGSTSKDTAIQIPTIVYSDRIKESSLLRTSSGAPAWYSTAQKKFVPIVTAPLALQDLHPAHIRCCLCNSIIKYPCWYYVERYNVTEKHYFVCSSIPEDKVTTKCLAKKGWRIK